MGLTGNQRSLQFRFVLKMGIMLLPLLMVAWISVSSLHRQRQSLDLILQEILQEKEPVMVIQDKLHEAVSLIYLHLLGDGNGDIARQFGILKGEIDTYLSQRQSMKFGLDEEWKSYGKVQASWQKIEAAAAGIFAHDPNLNSPETAVLYREVDKAHREIIGEFRHIHQMANEEISEAEREVRGVERKTVWAVNSTLLAGLIIVILVGIRLARSILQPMRVLGTGARELTSGNLDYRLQVDREDEFGALMKTFNAMASALQKSQEALKDLAIHDPLTGLYNHREFFLLLQDEVDRSSRYAHPVSLLMLDLDKFKQINDSLGHLTGDKVLQQVATVIAEQIRKSDHASRYGGDEFALLLPETDLPEAFEFAERLQQAVLKRPVVLEDGKPLVVTASIGVASFPTDASDYMDLVAVADHALYRAKANPHQKVCCGRQPAV